MPVFKKAPLSEPEIIQWLKDLRAHAYMPLSGFAVSCVVRANAGGEDYYFAGVNVENTDHRLSTHGEEGALAAMVTALGKKAEVKEYWVMGAPASAATSDIKAPSCGKCRQQLAGFTQASAKAHSIALNGERVTTTMGESLPNLFTFRQYIAELAAPEKTCAAPVPEITKARLIRTAPLKEEEIFQWLTTLEGVDYATQTSHMMVLELNNGHYVAGVKIEEAAFVSISAAQAAVAVAKAAYQDSRISKVFAYSAGRGEHALTSGTFLPLPLSDLQVLRESALAEEIPVTFFSVEGTSQTKPLLGWAQVPSVSSHPSCRIVPSPGKS